MQEKVYTRLNLLNDEILSFLDLGVAFYKVNQSGSPKDVKFDKNAEDSIEKARKKIERTVQLLYCNAAYVKQSGFTQEELLSVPDTALLSDRTERTNLEMAEKW